MSAETIIANIAEYVQAVCTLNNEANKFPHLQTNELLFRGQSNKDYELLPGIARGRHSAIYLLITNKEKRALLLKTLQKRLHVQCF